MRRQVALVEPHAFRQLELKAKSVRFLDGDDAFLADLVHRLGDQLADRGVCGPKMEAVAAICPWSRSPWRSSALL